MDIYLEFFILNVNFIFRNVWVGKKQSIDCFEPSGHPRYFLFSKNFLGTIIFFASIFPQNLFGSRGNVPTCAPSGDGVENGIWPSQIAPVDGARGLPGGTAFPPSRPVVLPS